LFKHISVKDFVSIPLMGWLGLCCHFRIQLLIMGTCVRCHTRMEVECNWKSNERKMFKSNVKTVVCLFHSADTDNSRLCCFVRVGSV